MSADNDQHVTSGGDDLARRNVRLALLLAAMAVGFFALFFVVLSR